MYLIFHTCIFNDFKPLLPIIKWSQWKINLCLVNCECHSVIGYNGSHDCCQFFFLNSDGNMTLWDGEFFSLNFFCFLIIIKLIYTWIISTKGFGPPLTNSLIEKQSGKSVWQSDKWLTIYCNVWVCSSPQMGRFQLKK